MKEKSKFKIISNILTFVLLFQYVSILVPFFTVQAAITATDNNSIKWEYDLSSNNAANIRISATQDLDSYSQELAESFEIPATLEGHNVTSIRYDIFNADNVITNGLKENLSSITIPDSVKSIGEMAFSSCTKLKTISVGNNNTNFSAENGVLFNKNKTTLILYPPAKEEVSYSIPNTVETIEKQAFKGCENLNQVTINNVINIKDNAFENSGLTSINLNKATNIIGNPFMGCENLTFITVADDNSSYKSKDGVLYTYSLQTINGSSFITKSLLIYPEGKADQQFTIPVENGDNSITIKSNAFSNCTKLNKIIFPKQVNTIEDSAFRKTDNTKLVCEENSAAHTYATNKQIGYILIKDVTFEDENLYNAIKAKCTTSIISSDDNKLNLKIMDEVTSIDLSNQGINSLSGLENLTELTTINAQNNHIIDVTPLDSLEKITSLNLKNQTCTMNILKSENDLPSILTKENEDKYKNGETVTYVCVNAEIQNGKLNVQSTDGSATVTITNGVLDGSTITVSADRDISFKTKLNGDKLEIVAEKNDEEINVKDIDFEYSTDGGQTYNSYTSDGITLDEGTYNVKVKYFGEEISVAENLEVNVLMQAVRKGNRIYIYTSSSTNDIKYSLEGENTGFTDYTEAIENTDKNSIWVKIGENNAAKKVDVIELKEMYDTQTNEGVENYAGNGEKKAVRENGIVKIPKQATAIGRKYYCSFDKAKWENLDNNTQSDDTTWQIKNDWADYVYVIGVMSQQSSIHTINIQEYSIVNVSDNEYTKIIGAYSENDKSYIFGQEKKYSEETVNIEDNKTRTRYTIVDDDNDIKQINDGKIIGITSVLGETLILKQDGKVYKIGNSYNDLQQITGSENIKQIEGFYAITNDNKIKVLNSQFSYEEDSLHSSDDNKVIAKCLVTKNAIAGDYLHPVILYTNGEVKTLGSAWVSNEVIAENIIDISSDGDIIYMLKYNKIICRDYLGNESNIDISDLLEKGEMPIKINKHGNILTHNGNYYEMKKTYEKDTVSENIKKYLEKELHTTLPTNTEFYISKAGKEQALQLVDINRTYDFNNPTKTGVKRLGDYTYEDNDGNIYYRTREMMYDYTVKIEEDLSAMNNTILERSVYNNYYKEMLLENKVYKNIENNSTIIKDESKLNEDKVIINVQAQDNIVKIIKPDGSETQNKSFSYVVTENGEYVFEFIDSEGNSSIKVVHVQTIQSRKETKVPKVTVLNKKIKLESDDKIEYSVDNENWTEYTEEIEYTEPIYARIKNGAYECSILKITLEDNGNLNVENTESRNLDGEILVNSVGKKDFAVKEWYAKNINYEEEIKNNSSNTSGNNTNKNLFDYISNIAENVIYNFSSTDGKFAGCYFEDNKTEIMYKDMDNNSVNINNFESKVTADSNIEYSVVTRGIRNVNGTEEEEKQKLSNGEILAYKKNYDNNFSETYISNYAYIDSVGNLETDGIRVLQVADEKIKERNANVKYTKIVGDGATFYILTEDGQVYLVTEADNGTWTYLLDRNKFADSGYYINDSEDNIIISKLHLRNIVNIYDTCTALTKDGKMISLIKDNEKDVSAVQELQKQTDKYLMASHLGLKDGKLYNFDNIRAGVEVTAGTIVESNESDIGIYSDGKIKLFDYEGEFYKKPNEENYITVKSTDTKLPEFIDIAECRDGYLVSITGESVNNVSWYDPSQQGGASGEPHYIKDLKDIDYTNTDKCTVCYAIAQDGEVWIYLKGYVIDTGINLDYFGPTANYALDTVNWTNSNINLTPSGNTKGQITKTVIYKGEDVVYDSDSNNATNKEIEKNGSYKITVTDKKGRSYTSNLNVVNIDKVKPVAQAEGEIVDKTATVKVYDVDDSTGDYAKSGIGKIQFTMEKPSDSTEWTDLQSETDEDGNTVITLKNIESNIDEKIQYTKTIDDNGNVEIKLKNKIRNAGNKKIYARAIDNAGNIGDTLEIDLPDVESGTVTVRYEDIEGNKIAEDKTLIGETGKGYKTEKLEIDTYNFVEVVGDAEGTFTKGDKVVIYKYEKVKGKVTVKYQDLEGNKLAEDKIITGKLDEDYKTEKIDINGYEFKEVVGNAEGKYTKEDKVVIYKYERLKGKVTVKYQDLEGNKLAEDKVITGKLDEDYKTEKIDINGYEFKEVVGNAEGKYTKDDQVVIYKYKKIEVPAPKPGEGKVIAKYEDLEGNKLQEDTVLIGKVGENYKTEKVDINKYTLIEIIGNEEGKYTKEDQVVIYKYEKVAGRVIVKYIDTDENTLMEDRILTGKVDDDYKTEKLKIDGYDLIEVLGNEEGVFVIEDQMVIYKYEKIKEPIIPQTGQVRIIYILLGAIIIASISSISYIDLVKKKTRKVMYK